MTWFLSLVGVALILLVLRDIFHTLWHPSGFGALSRLLFAFVWRSTKVVSRVTGPTEVAGPLALLVTALAWTSLLVLGWALIYWVHLPEGFHLTSPLRGEASPDFVTAVYLSMVSLATLGFGDIVPADSHLRIAVPLQALVGFVLLTAAISWALGLYPALNRRRTLARRLSMMASADTLKVVESGEPSFATEILHSLSTTLASTEMDLMQYGETYFFREKDREMSLAATLSYTLELVAAGVRSPVAEVRHAAAMLDQAATGVAKQLDGEFLHTGGAPAQVFKAFAEDHGHPPLGSASG